jgi:hypothetical protein
VKRCAMIIGFWLACVGLGVPLAFGYINGLGRNAPRKVFRAYETRKSERRPEQQALLDSWFGKSSSKAAAEREAIPQDAARQQAARAEADRQETDRRYAARQEVLREALTRLAGKSGTPGDRDLLMRWRNERKAGAVSLVFTHIFPYAA